MRGLLDLFGNKKKSRSRKKKTPPPPDSIWDVKVLPPPPVSWA